MWEKRKKKKEKEKEERKNANIIIISRQPWSTYAVHLTTLSPPALLGDLLLIYLCHKATVNLDGDVHWFAMRALGVWMFTSKFIKLMGHYRRYPVDFLLLPVSILFGYFHGAIKIYAAVTLNVVSLLLSVYCLCFLYVLLLCGEEGGMHKVCIRACRLLLRTRTCCKLSYQLELYVLL